jgi:hypothetical protein
MYNAGGCEPRPLLLLLFIAFIPSLPSTHFTFFEPTFFPCLFFIPLILCVCLLLHIHFSLFSSCFLSGYYAYIQL